MAEQDSRAETARVARDRLLAGENVDEVILAMRQADFSVIDCIDVLGETGMYPPDEVKSVVYNSEAWADVRDVHDIFHEALIREISGDQSMR